MGGTSTGRFFVIDNWSPSSQVTRGGHSLGAGKRGGKGWGKRVNVARHRRKARGGAKYNLRENNKSPVEGG